MSPSLTVRIEHWPIAGRFTISRGSRTEAVTVTAEIRDGDFLGRGECVPYPRYGESVEGVAKAIEELAPAIAEGLDRETLQSRLPAGAARNALDCALWDLAAKRAGKRVWEIADLRTPEPVTTAYTLSLGTAEEMEHGARMAADRPLLKVKLGAGDDAARIAAVRSAAPQARLIVDANEGWNPDNLVANMRACAAAGVLLIEQPLPAAEDRMLAEIERKVPVCADESVHDRAGLAELRDRYDAINIKLDKTGGLTEAIALAAEARNEGFEIMIGCMLGSSLAMAPALLLTPDAAVVDLDGPLLLAHDRPAGLVFEGSLIHPPAAELWG